MNIISFCLFGFDPKYNIGSIKNADLAKEVYPGWMCYFYVSSMCPPGTIFELKKRDNVVVILENDFPGWHYQQKRYKAMDIPEAEYAIFRDVDSRLNYREKACVDTWIKSGKDFMNMRDHPWHQSSIVLGGMWCAKGGAIPDVTQKINDFKNRSRYENDYHFLQEIVLPYMQKSVILFDEVLNTCPFPKERSYDDHSYFVGEVYDENDRYDKQHREVLEQFLRQRK